MMVCLMIDDEMMMLLCVLCESRKAFEKSNQQNYYTKGKGHGGAKGTKVGSHDTSPLRPRHVPVELR